MMLSSKEAIDLILAGIRPLPTIEVPVQMALGRVAGADVVAEIDVPGFDNASMDGFALSDVATTDSGARGFRIVGESAAGRPFSGSLRPGEAVRIMTGAPVPPGASAVLEVERVRESDGAVFFDAIPATGRNIRRAGEDVRRGAILIRRGTRLRPSHLGVLASLGRSNVAVARAPRVRVITTGTELVAAGRPLRPGEIYNSSGVVVPAMLKEAFAEVAGVETVTDEPAELRAAVERGRDSDLLITTGGVSAGSYDVVLETLRHSGVEIVFWKLKIKPGMPLAFGTWPDGRPVICLPGNPVSTAVTFQQFARPALNALEGAATTSVIRSVAQLEHEIQKSDGKRHFSRGIATRRDGSWTVRTTGSQSSGMLSSMALANCLIIIPEEVERLAAGDTVEVEWL